MTRIDDPPNTVDKILGRQRRTVRPHKTGTQGESIDQPILRDFPAFRGGRLRAIGGVQSRQSLEEIEMDRAGLEGIGARAGSSDSGSAPLPRRNTISSAGRSPWNAGDQNDESHHDDDKADHRHTNLKNKSSTFYSRHPREGGDPCLYKRRNQQSEMVFAPRWIPAFAGMTEKSGKNFN